MKLSKIHVLLHQMGFDTKAYKRYVHRVQKELDLNWFRHHTDEFWKYWHMCHVGDYDFTGEYDMAIRKYHLTPKEAYIYVFDEYINK